LTPEERQANAEGEQHSGWQGTWETIQRSHAIANGCYVAVPNRIGHETPAGGDGLVFWGGSFVADTSGNILKRAGTDKEEVLVVPVDLDAVGQTRTYWPFFRDRRIDAYEGITKRWLGKG
jgi:N-carbamoylputrescine amidase